MSRQELRIEARWDDEANVWYVADSDVPGLATGADTLEDLIRKLETVIPELLTENGMLPQPAESVPYDLIARRSALARSSANG